MGLRTFCVARGRAGLATEPSGRAGSLVRRCSGEQPGRGPGDQVRARGRGGGRPISAGHRGEAALRFCAPAVTGRHVAARVRRGRRLYGRGSPVRARAPPAASASAAR